MVLVLKLYARSMFIGCVRTVDLSQNNSIRRIGSPILQLHYNIEITYFSNSMDFFYYNFCNMPVVTIQYEPISPNLFLVRYNVW